VELIQVDCQLSGLTSRGPGELYHWPDALMADSPTMLLARPSSAPSTALTALTLR